MLTQEMKNQLKKVFRCLLFSFLLDSITQYHRYFIQMTRTKSFPKTRIFNDLIIGKAFE